MQLKKYRQDLHLSKEYVSKYLEISEDVLGSIESEQITPTEEQKLKLCRLYGISVNDISKDDVIPMGTIELGNMLFGHSRGEYPVVREGIEELFYTFFDKFKINSYGYADSKSPLKKYENRHDGDYYSIDTDVFTLMPYYWGNDEGIMGLPNFVYRPENIEIRWYKYPCRDAYSNIPLNTEKVKEILDKCSDWIKNDESKVFDTDICPCSLITDDEYFFIG